jgi:hypothetical protein
MYMMVVGMHTWSLDWKRVIIVIAGAIESKLEARGLRKLYPSHFIRVNVRPPETEALPHPIIWWPSTCQYTSRFLVIVCIHCPVTSNYFLLTAKR